jgi:hypothetical protein
VFSSAAAVVDVSVASPSAAKATVAVENNMRIARRTEINFFILIPPNRLYSIIILLT